MTSNLETAELLKRVAAVFRVKEGDSFRVKAYNNAATAIENTTEPIQELWKQGLLDTIPGIGEGLRKHLSEYFSKGRVPHWDAQFKRVPAGMFPLMEIRGVGPITAYKISKKFKLDNAKTAIGDLDKLIKAGKLTEIKSFKDKSVEKIRKALDIQTETKTKRMLLGDAEIVADDFLRYLKTSKDILDVDTLGSLRRHLPTVGDIDTAISAKNEKAAMDYALKYPQIVAIVSRGEKLSHVKLKNGYEVDIKLSTPDEWGSLLQHYTGSKMHNIKLRTLALTKKLSLSEYGIKEKKSVHKFKDEKSFYHFLGMSYIPPEIREDKGEIELALKNKVPELVELKDIRGDLHIHSDYDFPSSHDIGASPLSAILDFAHENKYEYLGISDHNPKFMDLTETQKKSILTKRKAYLIEQYRAHENNVKKGTINLLIGLEVDIRPDGDLALSEKLMEELDYAIVSIHSSFEQSSAKNTNRILEALSHPKAVILGHPTGRILNGRDSINADWDKIFDFCVKKEKVIEINAYPTRLDLPDDLIKQAIKYGVKLIVNTDSHNVSQLSFMKYGVWQAMRGYAEKKDIVNTFSYADLRRVLKLKS